jgi:hypothetical protein
MPAVAQEASLGTFDDVPLDHWAWLTVEMLVRKYHVMAGFPDKTFRGDKTVSRYELAAALGAVMDKLYTRFSVTPPAAKSPLVDKADLDAIKALAKSYDLKPVTAKITQLEADLAALEGKSPTAVTISGGSSTQWMDNTQDTLNPYLQTGLGVNLATTVEGVELFAGMGGAAAGVTIGNKPATASSGGAPDGAWHFGEAHATVTVADVKIRTGFFKPNAFFNSGTDLPFNWGGIVGNGFIYPNVNTVRWGDKNVSLAASRQFGPLKAAAAVNGVDIVAGLEWKPVDFLRLRLSADTNHPDYLMTGVNRVLSQNYFGVVDLGGDKLGVSLQGGLGKNLVQASGALTWNPFGGVRLGLGAILRTSEKATTEVTPGVSVFVPSANAFAPSVTVGVKEPQVVATSTGNPGPGSLLGELAGGSLVLNWKLEDYGFPNIKAEYNIQQPVLFYSIYDATFALEVGRGF